MTKCLSCARGLPEECLNEVPCDKEVFNPSDSLVAAFNPPVAKGRPVKENPEEIKDPHSTGRKRAATLFPLDRTKSCDWQGKINCGGGKYPIAGCHEGLQENIHHGPDKNTLNNDRENIHQICSNCHNTWHAANDSDYDDSCRTMRHSPVLLSTALDLIGNYTLQQQRRKKQNN